MGIICGKTKYTKTPSKSLKNKPKQEKGYRLYDEKNIQTHPNPIDLREATTQAAKKKT